MKKKFLKNRELLLGGRHLTFCVDIRVRLCYTIIVPKGTERYEVEDDDGNMKKYRVGIEISGYVERCVEAEDGSEAQDIVLDSIDWDDVEFSCEECEEIKDNSRKKYKIKAKGEN